MTTPKYHISSVEHDISTERSEKVLKMSWSTQEFK